MVVNRMVQCARVMRRLRTVAVAAATLVVADAPVAAQDPPPPIGPFVVDLRGSVPRLPNDPQLADSRGLDPRELPRQGLGLDLGAHLYLVKWRGVTFGIGGQLLIARARAGPRAAGPLVLRAVTERFTTVAPQLSFNFGDGDGWSYISGGIGPAIWSVVPDGEPPAATDDERLQTINYGGGARWFAKPHLAVTFDVRLYAINPGTPHLGRPGGPRTTLLVIAAGVALK
jgi:hypothetical protein